MAMTKPAAKKAPAKKTATAKPAKNAKSGSPLGTLDARPDRLDFRDLLYRGPLRSLPPRFPSDADIKRFLPAYVKTGLILNQGMEGACTGFGLACVANYLLWRRHLESGGKGKLASVSPRMFYELARHYDEWPGQDYDGSSCRGALKGWHKHGVCSSDLWPYKLDDAGNPEFVRPTDGWAEDATARPLGVYYRIDKLSVVDLQSAIAEIGAIYVSGTVHDGWDGLLDSGKPAPQSHADLPVIAAMVDPAQSGGHAFALVGYNERGFIVQNSWGTSWGAGGFGVLPYEDWVTNASDAWAVALGVAQELGAKSKPAKKGAAAPSASAASSAFRLSPGRALNQLARTSNRTASPADDPWPIDHAFLHAPYQPIATSAAYTHTVLAGNEGQLIVTDFTRQRDDRAGMARELIVERPLAWARESKLKTLKLAVYAHGGLNGESGSVERNRVLAPCFLANGVYPLFLTWKTGPGETVCNMIEDWVRHVLGLGDVRSGGFLEELGDAKDRAVEAAARTLGRGLWSEMRENAAAGAETGRMLALAADALRELQAQAAKAGIAVEVHLVGHSAGSILLGHLLDRLAGPAHVRVASCSLFAAACSTGFAVQHYIGAAAAGVLALDTLHLYHLSDANEKGDGLPSPGKPVYGKSLLYLVSRALDDRRKQPLLGMERALLPKYANDADQWDELGLDSVRQWQKVWLPLADQHGLAHTIIPPKVRNTRELGQIDATHGSFDNNIEVLTQTLERIKGAPLIAPLEWLDY